jgi:hypothetical protein
LVKQNTENSIRHKSRTLHLQTKAVLLAEKKKKQNQKSQMKKRVQKLKERLVPTMRTFSVHRVKELELRKRTTLAVTLSKKLV